MNIDMFRNYYVLPAGGLRFDTCLYLLNCPLFPNRCDLPKNDHVLTHVNLCYFDLLEIRKVQMINYLQP